MNLTECAQLVQSMVNWLVQRTVDHCIQRPATISENHHSLCIVLYKGRGKSITGPLEMLKIFQNV